MPNYTKSFNFRNGVQVDDDKFVVNSAGLVGIGTTRPQTLLDVRGPANITGVTSLSDAVVSGVVTVGAAITMDATSGVITATAFSGSASLLTNIVAIATDGWIKNSGTLSTESNIGIGTLTPNAQLDVVGDVKIVGFTTLSGVTTSIGTLFVNQLSASGFSTFVGLTSLSTLHVSSGSTFTGAIDANGGATIDNIQIGITGDNEIDTVNGDLTLDSASGQTTIDDNVNVSGILSAKSFTGPAGIAATFTNGINISSSGLTVSGVTTFNDETDSTGSTSGSILISGGVGFAKTSYFADNSSLIFGNDGDLEIVHVDNKNIIRSTSPSNKKLFIQNENQVVIANIADNNQSAVFNIGAGVTLKHNNVTKFETVVDGATVYGQLNIASLGGGTNGLSTYFGAVRYGNEEDTTTYGYSTRRSLDLVNEDSGNLNFYINYNNKSDIPTGDFRWFKGTAPKMTLVANTGNLGIGETDPVEKLHVAGIITTTSALFVATNLSVKGNLQMTGANSSITGNLNGNVSGNITGLVNATTGVSTFKSISVTDRTDTQFDGFGINKKPDSTNMVDMIGDSGTDDSKVFVTNDGNIGIGTTRIDDTININALQSKATFGAVGVGTTQPLGAIDFRFAGSYEPQNLPDGNPNPAHARTYAYLPTVTLTAAANGGLSGMEKGALVFDLGNDKLKYWNGANWINVGT